MRNVFFIGDTHFGHNNMVVKYDRTYFDCLEDMHETLIDNWNSVVNPSDIVWHLGDVAFGRANVDMISRCNGEKRLIMGNHDVYGVELYSKYFTKIFGANQYKSAILSHIPIHHTQKYRFDINIHGHVHHKDPILEASDFYYNVGADHTNLTPVHWEDIKAACKI